MSEHLRGAEWSWTRWCPLPALAYDQETGESREGFWTHDHCHFCYEKAFGERDGSDLREGWLHGEPWPLDDRDQPPPPGAPNYNYWVCPECFDRLRQHCDWVVVAPAETEEQSPIR
jgi:hypothetical protein